MKEELLKEAMELARKCRESYEALKKEKISCSIQRWQELFFNFVMHSWEFIGFYKALALSDIIDSKEAEGMRNAAIPESYRLLSESGLPAEMIDFIKGLKAIDEL